MCTGLRPATNSSEYLRLFGSGIIETARNRVIRISRGKKQKNTIKIGWMRVAQDLTAKDDEVVDQEGGHADPDPLSSLNISGSILNA
jgi:hypothetical protein